jgi:predicted short-subunit dehydrogenase-like oxidoreductase (DUF2520 family)
MIDATQLAATLRTLAAGQRREADAAHAEYLASDDRPGGLVHPILIRALCAAVRSDELYSLATSIEKGDLP